VRRQPDPGIVGQGHPPPAVPWRRSGRELRPLPHRLGPHGQRPTHQGLRDPPTRGRVQQQRRLKRAIAREIFRHLVTPVTVPGIEDLRPLRQAKNITLTAAANHLGVWPTAISELERGIRRNDDLVNSYREWLNAA
jgi:transposase